METLTVSDSTLRLEDEVGLSANVVCVPGGYLGDVATASADAGPATDLVVLAGVNEIVDYGKRMKDIPSSNVTLKPD